MSRDFAPNIDKETINEMPLKAFEGTVYIVDHAVDIPVVVSRLQKRKLLGFDTETRPNFKKGANNPVALLQLSTAEEAYLFRLNKTGLPKELLPLLTNAKVQKVGVAIKDDLKALQELKQFIPKGFIDLQDVVPEYGIDCLGLKKMTAVVLGFRISKGQQTSNWEAEQLSGAQIKYAATDAWVCHEIYQALQNKRP